MTHLTLYNTRTRAKAPFVPLDPANVRAYLCGPTVYDRAHIGNARNVVIFDVLIRLLRRLYPKVTYVRNITDVDDKINVRAKERGVSIEEVTAGPIRWYHEDMGALYTLPPDIEPRATAHIPEIIEIINKLILNGHAYEAEGHVLFSVSSDPEYGKFSGRTLDELIAGARVDVAPYKREAGDFVLWKPSTPDLPGWESPWGRGRPGWHIECSAMSWRHLGENFDIHGGGDDLIFPHHENEIAQSCCAFPGSHFANVWVHNRMLLVNGEKMSKSLGNFLVLHEVLEKAPGEAVRLMLMRAHYRQTLDFSDAGLMEARKELDRFYRALELHHGVEPAKTVPEEVMDPLLDDLNTPGALAGLHALADQAIAGDAQAAAEMRAAGDVLGLLNMTPEVWFAGGIDDAVKALAESRVAARKAKDFAESDRIRDLLLKDHGVIIEDGLGGTYKLRKA
ncbi:cysteine--tRNA ligase [Acidocella aminolytica]|uniref:Cysteine--tRNA ligase n=1 Tax=Acidocella aminolytica 101 = DSM 11237 TaxID=1120923 RepID=A0A0D6PBK7_9PROT|nr:cysteine--tRNA ligase [Acidocella aminolytica]GAN78731.1 cysteinyl-tRNA synthetase [Acidocella aminolytica 101 = DSM 11237]GBQ38709.1 cysteinyl-tRNA synthetase [Acidocella aminolytica 101 = DSM 11237]SHE78731.1 cysteinyl-tRNA synthetase [Acidocella aminolytica 101 = DSM 11237]